MINIYVHKYYKKIKLNTKIQWYYVKYIKIMYMYYFLFTYSRKIILILGFRPFINTNF